MSWAYPYIEQDDAYINLLTPACFASSDIYPGSAPLSMKFILGLYSAIGSFDSPARNITWSNPLKSSIVHENKSLFSKCTFFGRWFPNQSKSITLTSCPCSINAGTSIEPMYPAPPATSIFIIHPPSPLLCIIQYSATCLLEF